MDEVLVELDKRRRCTLRLGRHSRYLAREEPDGTIILQPALVLTESELALYSNPTLLRTIEADLASGDWVPQPPWSDIDSEGHFAIVSTPSAAPVLASGGPLDGPARASLLEAVTAALGRISEHPTMPINRLGPIRLPSGQKLLITPVPGSPIPPSNQQWAVLWQERDSYALVVYVGPWPPRAEQDFLRWQSGDARS